jgi:hypothetical protein
VIPLLEAVIRLGAAHDGAAEGRTRSRLKQFKAALALPATAAPSGGALWGMIAALDIFISAHLSLSSATR